MASLENIIALANRLGIDLPPINSTEEATRIENALIALANSGAANAQIPNVREDRTTTQAPATTPAPVPASTSAMGAVQRGEYSQDYAAKLAESATKQSQTMEDKAVTDKAAADAAAAEKAKKEAEAAAAAEKAKKEAEAAAAKAAADKAAAESIQFKGPEGNYSGSGTINSPKTRNGEVYTGPYNGQLYVNGITTSGPRAYGQLTGDWSYYKSVAGGYSNEQLSQMGWSNAEINALNSGSKYSPVGQGSYTSGTVTQTPTQTSTGNLTTGITSTATTTSLSNAAFDANRQSIIATLTDRFTKYGLSGLANKIRDLAIEGATESTITIQLQDTEEYQRRFSANQERIKKGLSVLSPADYLNTEDAYRQVLRSYGLNQFDNDQYVSQFIANDMSPTEFSNRVVTAVQRVQNADPAILGTLRDYYGIGNTDLVAYVLDPQQQFQKIQRQVSAAEVGAAARIQGLEPGVAVAEQLAAQGISQAEAQKGYATIADILPTSQKLSEIYGKTLDTYGQAEAEQEVFNTLASAQRKRRKLAETEQATFSGSSGAYRTALGGTKQGQF